jgi:hypothetical protein
MKEESHDNSVIREMFTDPEYSPAPVPVLEGGDGDGDGVYVIPRRYVEIQVGPPERTIKATAKQARQWAAELLNAADAIEVEL